MEHCCRSHERCRCCCCLLLQKACSSAMRTGASCICYSAARQLTRLYLQPAGLLPSLQALPSCLLWHKHLVNELDPSKHLDPTQR